MIILIIMIVALLLYGLFSSAASAFDTAGRLRIRMVLPSSGGAAVSIRHFLDNPARLRVLTHGGRSVSLVIVATTTSILLGRPTAEFFAGSSSPSAVTLLLTGGVVTFATAILILTLGEIVPRVMLRRLSSRAVFAVAVPLRVADILLFPFIWFAWTASVRIARSFGATDDEMLDAVTADLVPRADASPGHGIDGQTLFENVLELATVRVRDSMIPRTEIEAADEDASLTEVRRRFIETGLSRLPVYRENIDRITGMVFAHDLFAEPDRLSEIIRPARYVPESKLSKDLLQEFLATNTSIAVVIDEYGGTAGLVTREDLLEELFGDIQDEFDIDDDILRRIGNDVYILSGKVRVDEFNERYDLGLEEGDYDTIAGFILEHAGTVPTPAQEVIVGDFHFTILKATSSRIDLVKLTRRLAGDQQPS